MKIEIVRIRKASEEDVIICGQTTKIKIGAKADAACCKAIDDQRGRHPVATEFDFVPVAVADVTSSVQLDLGVTSIDDVHGDANSPGTLHDLDEVEGSPIIGVHKKAIRLGCAKLEGYRSIKARVPFWIARIRRGACIGEMQPIYNTTIGGQNQIQHSQPHGSVGGCGAPCTTTSPCHDVDRPPLDPHALSTGDHYPVHSGRFK